MSIRNLDHLFRPRSVALIGASRRPSSVGAVLARNLLRAGFDGPVMPVNPRHQAIEGVLTYPDVASLPLTPDLAVISTPPDTVPAVIADLARRGTRAAVVITAGFAEGDRASGRELQQAMLAAARPHTLRIIGPNCLGILVPGAALNASFSHLTPPPGQLAFVTQSGAVVTSVLDWAAPHGIGFSHLVSLGDMADVDFGDMLDYLANQAGTAAILLYVEAVTQARKFLSAARAAARMKPVIVVKSGRFEEGARAAASHTGAMAGSDAVYDAAFRRAGMLRVETLEELFAAVETLGMGETPAGDRLAILTNGGGMGVLATDALIGAGGCLAELAPATMAALDRELPPTWSRNNPVDVIGDADADRYRRALAALFADPGVDAVLALNCPSAVASSLDAARAVAELAEKRPRPALFTCWLGAATAEPARRLLAERRIPTYPTPGQAVQAFVEVIRYRQVQRMLMETPPSLPDDFRPDLDRARRPIERAVAAGREWLSEPEAKEVIAAYGIPVVPTLDAASADHAAQRAAELGGPVALKIVSPDITHKSDVGGVALDLDGPAAVREAALRMADRVALARPGARLDGFSVQPMVRRPGAHELIVGLSDDPLFGPVLLFGQGGTATEVVADRALGLPPLNLKLADELIRSTRVSRLLAGHRGQEGARLDDLALALVRLSQLAVDFDEVVELDVNPLLAGAFGVLALDARVRVAPPQRRRAERLAIRPYPSELEEEVALGDGRRLLLRPIRPEDEPSLQATFARLTPEEIRLRFFVPLKTMSHVMAARFTQLDYDREMALVLTERGVAGRTEIYGVARLSADPDNEHGEYAIIVRRDMTGMGLGVYLLRRLIDYARGRGLQRLWGDVLIDNATMRRLCQAMGFVESPVADEPGLVRVTLALTS